MEHSSIIDSMFIALSVLCFWHIFKYKKADAPLIFVSFILIHDLLFSNLDESIYGYYYISDAFINMLIILCISNLQQATKISIGLVTISFLSIVLDGIGWVMWMTYYSPDFYNIGFIGLYLGAIIILLGGDQTNVGGYTMGNWRDSFRVFSYLRWDSFKEYVQEKRA